MASFSIDHALKAAQWERAKGELRALVALQGSYSTSDRPPFDIAPETDRWTLLSKRVREFIEDIEMKGLHE